MVGRQTCAQLISYTVQDQLSRDGIAHSGLGPHTSINKTSALLFYFCEETWQLLKSKLGFAYRLRGLAHFHYSRDHGGMWAVMLLEKELRVLYPDLQATRRKSDTRPGLGP